MQPASSNSLVFALLLISFQGCRHLWQHCSLMFTWHVQFPLPTVVAGCWGDRERAGGCNISFYLIGVLVSELCWCLHQHLHCLEGFCSSLSSWLPLSLWPSVTSGQKGLGDKKYPSPAGLIPPSAGRGWRGEGKHCYFSTEKA